MFRLLGHLLEIEIPLDLFLPLGDLRVDVAGVKHFCLFLFVAFPGVDVVTRMGDEEFVGRQQLGNHILIFLQDVLDQQAGVEHEHVGVPLPNLFRPLPLVILEHAAGAVEAKELVEEPPNAGQVFPVPMPGRQLLVDQGLHELPDILLRLELPLFERLADVLVPLRTMVGQRVSQGISQFIGR